MPRAAKAKPLDATPALSRAILDSTLDPLVVTDARGKVLEASRSLEPVFGWKREDLIGRNVCELMPEPHRSAHVGYMETYLRTGRTWILGKPRELTGRRKDGTEFPIEATIWRVDVSGHAEPFFTGILRDVTARRAAETELQRRRDELEALVAERTRALETSHEQLRQADRLATIGTLAAGLGHDMSNVLLPIRCRLDALESSELPAAARDHFGAMRSSIDYLQQLTDGLHLLALNPDRHETVAGTTYPAQWWPKVEPLLARAVPREARFAADVPAGLPPIGVAPHRLTQAVLNLVVNAAEAIEKTGRVTVRIRGDGAREVLIEVIDDGHGMTEEVRRRALDPFFTTKRRGLGTGLGLALVDGTVRAAGGRVEIDSHPGRGTTVRMILPAAMTGRESAAAAEQRRAVVSVADARIGSFVAAMLGAARYRVERRDDPGDCRLWVTDLHEGAAAQARQLLEQPGRSVVVLGADGDPQWTGCPATIVHAADDFEEIRAKLGEAIAGIAPAEGHA
jgi:hypothetical protein